ncbi:MAG TPA: ATP-binding protein [Terracidiphilus sp.]
MNEGVWNYGFKPLAVAGFFVLVALLWTFPLQPLMAYPFILLFVAAIIGSSWFGGVIAGGMAIVLSSLLIAFFFIPPLYSISVGTESRTYVAAYLACGLVSTVISSLRKRSEAAIRVAKEDLEIRVHQRTAELERSNQEILERERQLRAIAEVIPQQIWAANEQGHIEYCNAQLLSFLGRAGSELKGEEFFDIFHPQDAIEFREDWESARAAIGNFELRARIRGPGDIYRWFFIRGIPQRAADGSVTRWYGIHIDIEEQQREEERLRQAQEDLSRSTRTTSMAEMAASIAHELNQPLAALMSDASACRRWLQSEPVNLEKAIRAAERIVHDTARTSAVVGRVRSLFSKTNYVRVVTDLNVLIRELSDLLREEAVRRKVSVELQLDPELPQVRVDPVQIQQVLSNLARNSMEAMPPMHEPRVIRIESRRNAPGEAIVSVNDTGVGMSETFRGRIFEPFFTTKPEGSGMGLAICRSILEAHEGRIWASSSPEGSAFVFALKCLPERLSRE